MPPAPLVHWKLRKCCYSDVLSLTNWNVSTQKLFSLSTVCCPVACSPWERRGKGLFTPFTYQPWMSWICSLSCSEGYIKFFTRTVTVVFFCLISIIDWSIVDVSVIIVFTEIDNVPPSASRERPPRPGPWAFPARPHQFRWLPCCLASLNLFCMTPVSPLLRIENPDSQGYRE